MSRPEIDAPGVTATAVGKHLDVTRQRVMQLVHECVLATLENGRFDLEDCRIRYIRWLRGADRRTVKAQASNRVTDARAREIELRVAEREGHLIEVDAAFAVVEDVVGIYRTRFSALPVRVTKDVALRRKIEAEIDDIQSEVADALRERETAVRSGEEPVAAAAEDDA